METANNKIFAVTGFRAAAGIFCCGFIFFPIIFFLSSCRYRIRVQTGNPWRRRNSFSETAWTTLTANPSLPDDAGDNRRLESSYNP